MARRSNSIPEYRHHKGTNKGYIRFAPFWGAKRHYFPGEWNSDESRYAYTIVAAKIAEYLRAQPPPASQARGPARPKSVAELILGFAAHAEIHYGGQKSSEYGHYKHAWQPLKLLYARTLCQDFGPLALVACRDWMLTKRPTWSRKYINRQIDKIRAIFKWGVAHEYCDATVLLNLKAVAPLLAGKTAAREVPKVGPVAWSVAQQVLPFVTPVAATMIQVQFLSGMRPGEVVRMRGEELDRHADDIWYYLPERHKTAHLGKSRIICLGPQCIKLLAPYDRPKGYLFQPTQALQQHAARRLQARKTPLRKQDLARVPRVRDTNSRYSTRTYYRAVQRGIDAQEQAARASLIASGHSEAEAARLVLPRWFPNQLRHARATELNALYAMRAVKHEGLRAAQVTLGHAVASTTTIYAEESLRLAAQIAKEIG